MAQGGSVLQDGNGQEVRASAPATSLRDLTGIALMVAALAAVALLCWIFYRVEVNRVCVLGVLV